MSNATSIKIPGMINTRNVRDDENPELNCSANLKLNFYFGFGTHTYWIADTCLSVDLCRRLLFPLLS